MRIWHRSSMLVTGRVELVSGTSVSGSLVCCGPFSLHKGIAEHASSANTNHWLITILECVLLYISKQSPILCCVLLQLFIDICVRRYCWRPSSSGKGLQLSRKLDRLWTLVMWSTASVKISTSSVCCNGTCHISNSIAIVIRLVNTQ